MLGDWSVSWQVWTQHSSWKQGKTNSSLSFVLLVALGILKWSREGATGPWAPLLWRIIKRSDCLLGAALSRCHTDHNTAVLLCSAARPGPASPTEIPSLWGTASGDTSTSCRLLYQTRPLWRGVSCKDRSPARWWVEINIWYRLTSNAKHPACGCDRWSQALSPLLNTPTELLLIPHPRAVIFASIYIIT